MAELTDHQRQLLAMGLSRPSIPGSAPILPPSFSPHGYADLTGLPSPVVNAIAPNIGTYFGKKGDFVSGVNPPATNESDPTMIMNTPPPGDQSFEKQDMPWWHGDRILRKA